MVIEGSEDLAHIQALDEGRWFATSVPIASLMCDRKFLEFVDTDKNGRIRTDELKEAQAWLFRMLSDRSRLAEETDALALASIDASHKEGRALRTAARRILANLGRSGREEITLAEVRSRREMMSQAGANGDGVIPAEAAGEEGVAQFIHDVGGCMGTVPDASGLAGITAEILDAFEKEAKGYLDWLERGRIPEGAETTEVMIYGEATPARYAALAAVREKVEAYFALSALARVDGRVAEQAELSDEEIAGLDGWGRARVEERLLRAPLAPISRRLVLRLDDRLNPAYRAKMEAFAESALGEGDNGELTLARWEELKQALAPYAAWIEGKAGSKVEGLGEAKLRAYLAGREAGEVRRIIEEDKAVAVELAEVANVEKLVLYQRRLVELANNFVSFPRFYDPERRSLVEFGTLVLDGRRFGLCLKVEDRAEHKKVAERSHVFVMYVEILRRAGEERFEAATAVTAGDASEIFPGKRGVFITLDGREWEATVTEVITNPVSVWEALKLPFKRLAELVGKFTERFSGARSEEMEKKLAAKLEAVEKGVTTPAAAGAAGAPAARSGIPGLLVGGGVAFAALGSTLAYVASKVSEIDKWDVVKVLAAIFAIIAIPTVIVAVVKLRRRNMSRLLEASGWAVNRKIRLTALLGRHFTEAPRVPSGAMKRRFGPARAKLQKEAERGGGKG